MSSSDPAFGRMLRQLVDLGVITINTEPLDAAIERRLKQFWESTTCPRCGNPSLYTWESSDRVCCRNCPFKPVYTYGTPFHEKHLSCGEVLLAFMLYADTLLNISDIEVILDRAYKTVFYAIREVEAAVHRGFPSSGVSSSTRSLDQRRSTSLERSVPDSKAKTRRETAVIAAGRPGLDDHAGKVVTAIN